MSGQEDKDAEDRFDRLRAALEQVLRNHGVLPEDFAEALDEVIRALGEGT